MLYLPTFISIIEVLLVTVPVLLTVAYVTQLLILHYKLSIISC